MTMATSPSAGSLRAASPRGDDLLARRSVGEWLRQPDVLAVALLTLVMALLAWQRLVHENGLAWVDIPTLTLPWFAHLGEAVRALDAPGWNPYVLSGAPFAGDPQSGWWYFPVMVSFTLFEPVLAFQVLLVFHLMLAGLSTYALCRLLGLRPLAGLAGAIAYGAGPFVSYMSCCLIHFELGAWIPTLLIGLELTVRQPHWRGRALGWVVAGLAISQILAAWPGQGAYNALLLAGGYLAVRTLARSGVSTRDMGLRLLADGAGVLAFGFGIAAAGLLPRLDVVSRTNVAGGGYAHEQDLGYVSGWRIYTLLSRVFTDREGLRFYLGAPALVLAVAALVLAPRRPWVLFLAAITVLVWVLALEQTPLHELFFLLPRFEELHSHVPSRILVLQWIGPALLVAVAVDAIFRGARWRRLLLATGAAAGVWAGVVLALVAVDKPVERDSVIAAGITCLVLALLALASSPAAQRWGSGPAARTGLVGVLLLALLVEPSGRAFVESVRSDAGLSPVLAESNLGPVARSVIDENAATTDAGGAGEFLQQRQAAGELFRYIGYEPGLMEGQDGEFIAYRQQYANPLAIALLVNARAMRLGLFDAQGFNSVQLDTFADYLTEINERSQDYHDAQVLSSGITSPLLDLLNVRYIIVPVAPFGADRPDIAAIEGRYTEVFRNDVVRVLENPNALPRAWVVHDIDRVTPSRMPKLLRAGAIDPRTTLLLDKDEPEVPASPATGADEVQFLSFEADRIVVRVRTSAPGALVLSEIYDEGWDAQVNGDDAPVYRAYGVIRSVPVGAGESIIELTYAPRSLRIGLAISAVAVLGALVVIGIYVVGRRRPAYGVTVE